MILDGIPSAFSSIIVSYDNGNERRSKIKNQIARASKLFNCYPNALHDFLVKSSSAEKGLNVSEVIDNIPAMSDFHIIGLTEKELGSSLIDRMKNIAEIRKALNAAKNNAPLHIFGCLDPISTVLYFLAGAEIFDGLTWLRFSYYNGLCVYRDNYNVLKERSNNPDVNNFYASHIDNVTYLRNLQGEMRTFLKESREKSIEEALKSFKHNSEFITSCFKQFNSL